jgi:ribulose-phosphate 3-epimerase
MRPVICPAILAATSDEYSQQIERVSHEAVRLHIDLTDGVLASAPTIAIDEVWWPGGMQADLHVMYRQPFEHAELLFDLKPQLIIVHAEAEGDFVTFADRAHAQGIKTGVAIQPQTDPAVLEAAIGHIDHVLIFSGHLGHFGGQADLGLLTKVAHLKTMKPQLEIGWDGGVNDHNVQQLAQGGIHVLNSGGFIQKANDPHQAFRVLSSLARA